MSAVGDLIYGGTAGTRTRLAPNTTTTSKHLEMTGDGSGGLAPTWVQPTSRTHFSVGASGTSSSTYAVQYISGFNTLRFPSTEALASTVYPYAFTVRHLAVKFTTNGLNGSTVITFRDDTADASGVTATITAASTAEFTYFWVKHICGSRISDMF